MCLMAVQGKPHWHIKIKLLSAVTQRQPQEILSFFLSHIGSNCVKLAYRWQKKVNQVLGCHGDALGVAEAESINDLHQGPHCGVNVCQTCPAEHV